MNLLTPTGSADARTIATGRSASGGAGSDRAASPFDNVLQEIAADAAPEVSPAATAVSKTSMVKLVRTTAAPDAKSLVTYASVAVLPIGKTSVTLPITRTQPHAGSADGIAAKAPDSFASLLGEVGAVAPAVPTTISEARALAEDKTASPPTVGTLLEKIASKTHDDAVPDQVEAASLPVGPDVTAQSMMMMAAGHAAPLIASVSPGTGETRAGAPSSTVPSPTGEVASGPGIAATPPSCSRVGVSNVTVTSFVAPSAQSSGATSDTPAAGSVPSFTPPTLQAAGDGFRRSSVSTTPDAAQPIARPSLNTSPPDSAVALGTSPLAPAEKAIGPRPPPKASAAAEQTNATSTSDTTLVETASPTPQATTSPTPVYVANAVQTEAPSPTGTLDPFLSDGPSPLARRPTTDKVPTDAASSDTSHGEVVAQTVSDASLIVDKTSGARLDAAAASLSAGLSTTIPRLAAAIGGLAASTAPAAPDAGPAATGVAPIARTLTLQMSPADLGTIDVKLHMSGDTLDVSLTVSDQRTLGVVSHGRDELASSLQEQTYQLNSLVIQDGSGAPQPGGHHATPHDSGGSSAGGGDARQNTPSGDPGSGQRRERGSDLASRGQRSSDRTAADPDPGGGALLV